MKRKGKIIVAVLVFFVICIIIGVIIYLVKRNDDDKDDDDWVPTSTGGSGTDPFLTGREEEEGKEEEGDDLILPFEKGHCENVGPDAHNVMVQNRTQAGDHMQCWKQITDGYTYPEILSESKCTGFNYNDNIIYASVPCGKKATLQNDRWHGKHEIQYIEGPWVGEVDSREKIDKIWVESSHTNWAFNNAYPVTISQPDNVATLVAAKGGPTESQGYCNKYFNTQACVDFCLRTDLSVDDKRSCKSARQLFCSLSGNRNKTACRMRFPE
jgi:hypothetical protein